MKLNICAADPAGNVTILVESPVDRSCYESVARKLMALESLRAEQVGFLVPPRQGGAVRLEMMGGEFCGNAARCTGLWYGRKTGARLAAVEISGCGHVLPVELTENGAWTEMPLPLSVEETVLDGMTLTAVRFEGILHLIREGLPPTEAQTASLLPRAAALFGAPAVGLLSLQGDSMIPAVYVQETDSLVWENSCGSGSAAVISRYAQSRPDGVWRLTLRQPGGEISAEAVRRGGAITSVRIGGPVTMGETILLEL